jgi:hypothetical protein
MPLSLIQQPSLASGVPSATNITAGTLPPARLPAGSVLQVVQTIKGNTYSQSATAFATIPDFSVTLTPISSTSKILVTVQVSYSGIQNSYIAFQLQRNGSNILVPTETGTGIECSGGGNINTAGNSQFSTYKETFSRLDSPNTTSSVTYSVQVSPMRTSGDFLVWINRSEQAGDDNQFRTVSIITAMEIAG